MLIHLLLLKDPLYVLFTVNELVQNYGQAMLLCRNVILGFEQEMHSNESTKLKEALLRCMLQMRDFYLLVQTVVEMN